MSESTLCYGATEPRRNIQESLGKLFTDTSSFNLHLSEAVFTTLQTGLACLGVGDWSSWADNTYDVVLSSGFLAFASHSGFLKAIDSAGLAVGGIMGTSAGALTGSLYSAGYSPEEVRCPVGRRRRVLVKQHKRLSRQIMEHRGRTLIGDVWLCWGSIATLWHFVHWMYAHHIGMYRVRVECIVMVGIDWGMWLLYWQMGIVQPIGVGIIPRSRSLALHC